MQNVQNNKKKKKTGEAENTTQDLRDASGPSIDPSNVHWSLISNGLNRKAVIKEGETGEKAKLHRNWIENKS